jgi:hypothetical protein
MAKYKRQYKVITEKYFNMCNGVEKFENLCAKDAKIDTFQHENNIEVLDIRECVNVDNDDNMNRTYTDVKIGNKNALIQIDWDVDFKISKLEYYARQTSVAI